MTIQMCYNPSGVLPFLQAALTRRVDIALMSDSNTVKDTYGGHNSGMRNAFASRFGMYSTGMLPAIAITGSEGYGSGSSGSYLWPAPATVQEATGITAIDAYQANTGVSEAFFVGQCWQYLASGSTITGQQTNIIQAFGLQGVQLPLSPTGNIDNQGKIIHANPMDLTQELSWEWTQGIFTSGGYWNPTVYQTAATNTQYATAKVSSNGAAYGMQDGNLIIPAGARNSNGTYGTLTGSPCNYVGGNTVAAGVKGPVLISYQRVQAPGVLTGIAYHTNLYQGGQDARNAALSWQGTSSTAKTEFMRQLVRLQNGATPMACFQIIHGGNDFNDNVNSVGPHPQPSNTPAGFADNLTAIIQAVQAAWTTAGYSLANLYFLIGPYHPALSRLNDNLTWQGQSYQQLVAYELAAMSLVSLFPNLTVIRGSQAAPGGFQASGMLLQSRGFYDYQSDAHMIRQGYDYWGYRAIDALVAEAFSPSFAPVGYCAMAETIIVNGLPAAGVPWLVKLTSLPANFPPGYLVSAKYSGVSNSDGSIGSGLPGAINLPQGAGYVISVNSGIAVAGTVPNLPASTFMSNLG